MSPGTKLVGVGVAVVLDALDEGGGAVAHADDRDADLVAVPQRAVAGAVRGPVAGAVALAHLDGLL